MKKQKTLEEKKAQKEALKMTASFIGIVVVLETVIIVLISIATTYIGGLTFERMPIIEIACFDIVLAIVGYLDFKREVIGWQKKYKDNERTE